MKRLEIRLVTEEEWLSLPEEWIPYITYNSGGKTVCLVLIREHEYGPFVHADAVEKLEEEVEQLRKENAQLRKQQGEQG